MSEENLIMVIDRIVSGIAVCEMQYGEGAVIKFQVPAYEIPDAEAGGCYEVLFDRSKEIEEQRRKRIRAMQNELIKRSGK